jgi:hypothetical protein
MVIGLTISRTMMVIGNKGGDWLKYFTYIGSDWLNYFKNKGSDWLNYFKNKGGDWLMSQLYSD